MIRALLVVSAILLTATASRSAEDDAARRVAAQVRESIVHVNARGAPHRFGLPPVGVIVGNGRIVLTLSRRCKPGDSATVRMPGGERRSARVVARDPDSRITALVLLSPATNGLGLRAARLRPGDPVLTGGHAFGTRRGDGRAAVGQGVVAQVVQGQRGVRYLLTIAVNPGDYGGALVDRNGRLAGLLTLTKDEDEDGPTGLSTAVSVTRARVAFRDVPELKEALAPAPGTEADEWPVQDRLREVARSIAPRVVSILVNPREDGGYDRIVSGLEIDDRGHILTTKANLGAAGSFKVVFPGARVQEAKLRGTDARLGIALLEVPEGTPGAAPVFARESTMVGSFVVAVGNTNGLKTDRTQLVSMGIIGGTNRYDRQYGALHTDAAVNRGNVGGPLLDLDGRVVGILTSLGGGSLVRLGTNSGLGFAIPSPAILERLEALKAGRDIEFKPGYLGVVLSYDVQDDGGVKIDRVVPGEAAAKAGIRPGDVVHRADAAAIGNVEDARRVLGDLREGQKVSLAVRREGKEIQVPVTLGPWPASVPR